jgi:hypothetical protein
MNAIDARVSKGYTVEKFRFLGINVVKRVMLDEYDKSKLVLEKKRAELDLFEKKRYYEMWLGRSQDYDKKFEQLRMECEANYDTVHSYAEQVREYNLRLADAMGKYSNPNNDIRVKVEYYLYIKQEVENAIKAGRIKFTTPAQSTTPMNNPNPSPALEVVK